MTGRRPVPRRLVRLAAVLRSGAGRWRRLALLLATVGVLTAFLAPSAQALPLIGDCKPPPTPHMPTSGLTGYLLQPPGPDAGSTSLYARYGTVPTPATYDLGCGGAVRDVSSSTDNLVAGWMLGTGKALVAATDSLHSLLSPPKFLSKLDPLIVQGTQAVHDALYTPWIGVSLLLLAITLMARSARGSLHWAVSAVGWALLVMAGAATVAAYPIQSGRIADSTITNVVDGVNVHLAGDNTGDPASARAAMITDSVLWHPWLRAELGSDSSAVAQKYGEQLLDAQAYTWLEAATLNRDPKAGEKITQAKQDAFKDIASKIEKEDPDAYTHLKGQAGDRSSSGGLALLSAALVTPFMALADLLIVVALVILRLAVMLFPALAVLGLHRPLAGLVRGALTTVSAALINSAVFAVGAAFNALAVKLLLDSGNGLPPWFAQVMCGVFTVGLWHGLKPFRRLTAMVSPGSSPLAGAVEGLDGQRSRMSRGLRRVAGIAGGSYLGTRAALEQAAPATVDGSAGTPEEEGEDGTYRIRFARPEEWSRPQRPTPPAALPAGPVAATTAAGTTYEAPAAAAAAPGATEGAAAARPTLGTIPALPAGATPLELSAAPAALLVGQDGTDQTGQLPEQATGLPSQPAAPVGEPRALPAVPAQPADSPAATAAGATAGPSSPPPTSAPSTSAPSTSAPSTSAPSTGDGSGAVAPEVLPAGPWPSGGQPPRRADPVLHDGKFTHNVYVRDVGSCVMNEDGQVILPSGEVLAERSGGGDA